MFIDRDTWASSLSSLNMSPMQVEEIVVRCRQLDVVCRQQLVHFFHPFLVRLALEMLLDSFWAVYDVYLAHRAIRSRPALCQNTLRLAVELFNRTPGLGLFHRRLCQGLGLVPALGTRCEAGSGDHEGGLIALVIRRYIMCVMFVCEIHLCGLCDTTGDVIYNIQCTWGDKFKLCLVCSLKAIICRATRNPLGSHKQCSQLKSFM